MGEQTSEMQLVVVGSSAGGIDALSILVASLPSDFAAPLVIAQHLDPTRPSHLSGILARRGKLPVHTVTDHETLKPGVVYVVPANHHVEITATAVQVRIAPSDGPRPSVDLLLSSAAEVFGERLIAVILTGSGADGAAGARDVNAQGGTVIIQNPETASFPSMPLSLSPTVVDIVADIENIGAILVDLTTGKNPVVRPLEERMLRTFLEQLRERSGIDFNTYKTPTIMRRLQRRMMATGAPRLTDYIRYLQTHPDEYQRLVSSFLIKVTEFFRDEELYNALREQILPELIVKAREYGNELRFWSAGTATGEEAYSLAILVSELLGDDIDQFIVRIFATDLDNDAITFARRGIYPAAALANLPPGMVARYFTEVNGEYEIKKAVRSLTVFGQHDLGQRAPFPRIDLALCRNVLIYFTVELQKRALQLFAFSLRDGGYLVLGKAETTSPLAEYFMPELPHLKIYRRYGTRILIPPARIRDAAPLTPPRPGLGIRTLPPPETMQNRRETIRSRVQRERFESLLLALPIGVVVVDRRYDIQFINNTARRLFGIHMAAIGEDFLHLSQNVPPDSLRPAIDAALRGEPVVQMDDVLMTEPTTGDLHYLQIICYPQKYGTTPEAVDTVLITVSDITLLTRERQNLSGALTHQREETERLAGLMRRLAETNRQLLEANQDLNRANTELRNANEEFLVANEEAQAATEEIETLNEELQATNEELETLNEELQATVEELNTTNDDLQARSVELQDLAASLEAQRRASETERDRLAAVLVNLGDAVLVVGPSGETVLTNDAYTRMFGGPDATFAPEDENGNLLPPEMMPQQRAAHGESFRTEFTLTAPDGSRRWFEANGQSIHSDTQDGGVLVIRDISERSIRRLQDEFLAMASHELRTPLTTLNGYLQLLTRLPAAEGDARIREYANLARQQGLRLVRLVNELLDVARLQTGKLGLTLEPMELGPVVLQAVEAARIGANGQEIRLEMDTAPLRIAGDAGRIEQVLLNLLTNAIAYAPHTAAIDVRVHGMDGEAEIAVQDYGSGIPAEDLPNLFTRFYQVRRAERSSQRGLGLGLFISREIILAHNGTISVQSNEGEGTTFTICIPLLDS